MVLLKNTTVTGLKRWRCGKLSNSACASRGFVGLQIKRDGGDLKIESNSHLSAVKALELKLNTLNWGIFGWFVYSVRYLVKFYKIWGDRSCYIPSLASGHSCLSNGRTHSAFYRTWILTTGRSISSAEGCQIFNHCYFLDLHWPGHFFLSSFSPHWNLNQWLFVCPDLIFMALLVSGSKLLCRLNCHFSLLFFI